MTTEEIVWEEIDKVRNENSALLLLIEEKDKEIAELKKSTTLLHEAMVTAEQRGVEKGNADYQKLKAENEAMHEKLQQALNRGANDYEEIERLKGLIEKMYRQKLSHLNHTDVALNNLWYQFKTENNL